MGWGCKTQVRICTGKAVTGTSWAEPGTGSPATGTGKAGTSTKLNRALVALPQAPERREGELG